MAQQVSDETLRMAVLRAIFPGIKVSLDPGKKIDDSWPEKPEAGEPYFQDALRDESVYTITGRVMNDAEGCASQNLLTDKSSSARQLRFRVFRWPKENNAGLLAVLQYTFRDASPAMACPSIGLVVHLVKNSANWTVKDRYLLETTHHGAVDDIRLLDLTGKGTDQLVIESDSGGAGTALIDLYVFDLSRGRLDEVLDEYAWISYAVEDSYTQTLDLGRTRESQSQQFCFLKTTTYEKGKPFHPSRVTHPCYKRGDGIDSAAVTDRNKMLISYAAKNR